MRRSNRYSICLWRSVARLQNRGRLAISSQRDIFDASSADGAKCNLVSRNGQLCKLQHGLRVWQFVPKAGAARSIGLYHSSSYSHTFVKRTVESELGVQACQPRGCGVCIKASYTIQNRQNVHFEQLAILLE